MIKNLQSIRYLDKKSQAEIVSLIKTFDKIEITQNNIFLLLKFAFRIALFDKSKLSLQISWSILEYIQTLSIPLESLISIQLVEDILNDELITDSFKIISWILNNSNSEAIKMAVKQKVVERVGPSGSNRQYTLDDLNKIIYELNLLTTQPELMPTGSELEELCTNIVLSLGKFQMPKEASAIGIFVNNVEKIKDFLQAISEMLPKEIQFVMLSALYKSISESKNDAGPGLVVVLQLIKTNFITDAVRWLLAPKHDDASLVRGLNVLVGWLFKWTKSPELGRWVIAFMNGLHQQKRYRVLEQVTLDKIGAMFKMLRLPAYRASISVVLFHMLCSMQHSPAAFLIAVDHLPHEIEHLRRENSDSSLQCLQSIVDICTALMEHFPQHDYEYDKLRNLIKNETPSDNYRDVLNVPSWCDGVTINSTELVTTAANTTQHNVPGKIGLINLGNTCYMNSVLQSLFMTMPFRNEILSFSYCVKSIEGLQALFAMLQFSKRCAIQPPDNLLSVRPPGFHPGLQHDSSEYMGFLLDTIHEQEKAQSSLRFNSIQNEEAGTVSESNGSTTIVQRIFGGQTKTTYRCDTCNGESIQNDPFRDIQLSFPPVTIMNVRETNSVQELLDYYLEPEQLCGENRYWCDRCAALSNAERVLQVTQTPRNLILTLKHFRYDPKLQQRAKLFQSVSYDQEIYLNKIKYELYAAVVHSGPTVDSGHYYTYARDNSGVWYKFNDGWVSRTSMTEFSSLQQPATPYILFYQRENQNVAQPLAWEALNAQLQSIVKRDLGATAAENRRRTSTNSTSTTAVVATAPILRKHSDDDDDNDDPPSFCGSGDFSSNAARFVC